MQLFFHFTPGLSLIARKGVYDRSQKIGLFRTVFQFQSFYALIRDLVSRHTNLATRSLGLAFRDGDQWAKRMPFLDVLILTFAATSVLLETVCFWKVHINCNTITCQLQTFNCFSCTKAPEKVGIVPQDLSRQPRRCPRNATTWTQTWTIAFNVMQATISCRRWCFSLQGINYRTILKVHHKI